MEVAYSMCLDKVSDKVTELVFGQPRALEQRELNPPAQVVKKKLFSQKRRYFFSEDRNFLIY